MTLRRVITIGAVLALGCSSPRDTGRAKEASLGMTASAGTAHFSPMAGPNFDAYTMNPSPEQQQWMRDHYWRMLTYTSYFDTRTSWYPNAWVYLDSYAIYPYTNVPTDHPDWILKDAGGARLYIQYACSGGTCPQYAADIGNPAYRAYWLDAARSALAHGYRGLFIDDVNLDWRISDGTGAFVNPIDPRTGAPMTLGAWRAYFADFMQEVRAAFPAVEIVHNALWFVSDADADVARELAAANYVFLERGANDAGLTGGAGTFGYESLLAYVDRRHAAGTAVVFESYATTRPDCEYNMASYFLVSNGNDASACLFQPFPDGFWPGYDASIGAPRGDRYAWNGVLRRDFDGGVVLVNEPGSPTRTVTLDGAYASLDGQPVTSVTLEAARAAVLVGSSSTPPPPPPSAPPPPPPSAATITGPSPVAPGTTVTVSWANVPAAWWNDYVVLCPAGAPDGGACVAGTRLYADSCSTSKVDSGQGTPTGSCAGLPIPASLPAGDYEYRYYRYDGWYDLQAASPVTVATSPTGRRERQTRGSAL